MMDYIRQLQVAGRRTLHGADLGGSRRPSHRRPSYSLGGWEPLERRELLSTTQNFDTPGTTFSLQQVAGPPAAQVQTGGPTGNFLRLATTPGSPVAGNDNSISFVTSDPGTFNQVTADWDFRVTQTTPGLNGVGMSFALLNTGNYGTSGNAASLLPQQGIYDGSLAFGFDTTNDLVFLSLKDAVVTGANLTGQLDLAGGQFIHAHALVDFQTSTVSLVLTPSLVGLPVTVFSSTSVTGLGPYQSRVSLEAKNSTTTFANFDLDNVNVQYSGARSPGTISFGSSSYTVLENQPSAQIDVIRTGGTAGTFTITFVAADGTGRNGVNYQSVTSSLTFGEGQGIQTINIPIIDDHLFDGDKTVKLFISNPTLSAPIAAPIVATLTIVNTDLPAPTVTPPVQLLHAAHTRRVTAFRVQFSQTMNATAAQNVSNYEVLLPPAHKHGPVRVVTLSQAVLDPSGMFVTLYRADLGRQHLTNRVQIVVRGKPSTGLIGTNGTFLAGAGGVSGTDALLTVSV
jgi:hypothetical protein